MRVMTEPGTEFISFFRLQEPYTSVQLVDRPIATILGSALHQRLCQQGLFRRRPMTGCNVAGVFGQNGAIQTGAGGRDREASRGVGKRREKLVRHRRDRAERSMARQMEGVEELAKLSLTETGASWQSGNIVWNQSVILELLSLSLRCGTRSFTVTICSVLSQFDLRLGIKVTALQLPLAAKLAVWLSVNQLSTLSNTVRQPAQ